MRILLIVNTAASSFTARKRVVIQKALSSDHEVEVVETVRGGHASRLARAAAHEGVEVVATELVAGGEVPSAYDGHPDAWYTPNAALRGPAFGGNRFAYPNRQPASTLWFHDHSMGITRLDAYAGAAAFYIIKDPVVESAGALANLPKGRYANPVVPSLQSDEFDLPLAAAGTDFQRQVWSELRRIPYGTTISYGELARRIGNPQASRAVGLANGRNPISIIVPCHRVIGATGTLTGYGGGLERKRWLLDHEAGERQPALL